MVNDRFLVSEDLPMLEASLEKDTFHIGTKYSFFTQPGTLSKVYELDGEPILVARACKSLRMDIQFLDNNDVQRNRQVMLEGFPELEKRAKENGFHEIIFNTSNPLLKRFCEKRLGFNLIDGDDLRKAL